MADYKSIRLRVVVDFRKSVNIHEHVKYLNTGAFSWRILFRNSISIKLIFSNKYGISDRLLNLDGFYVVLRQSI